MTQASGGVTQPFLYSGYLEEDGKGVEGQRTVGISVWSAESGGIEICTKSANKVAFVRGRFSIPLPSGCEAKLSSSGAFWVELEVHDKNNHPKTLGRSRVGVVPFARHAANCTTLDGKTLSEVIKEAVKQTQPKFVGYAKDAANKEVEVSGNVKLTIGDKEYKGRAALNAACRATYGSEAHLCTEKEVLQASRREGTQVTRSWWDRPGECVDFTSERSYYVTHNFARFPSGSHDVQSYCISNISTSYSWSPS